MGEVIVLVLMGAAIFGGLALLWRETVQAWNEWRHGNEAFTRR